jgi:Cyclic nucleotide-binding domain/Major Facilitator Superfamily
VPERYRREVIKGTAGQLAASLRAVGTVFANPDVARLELAWAGMSFSLWAFAIALGVYAFDVAGPAAVGIAALVRLLPGALASPFAGLLGDRHSRRGVLTATTIATAAVLGGAAAATALDAPPAVVFGLAGAFTVASSPYVPAEGALYPQVSRTPQELSGANVAHGVMDSAGFLVGSTLTGVLLAATTPQVVFGLAAIIAALTALVLAGVRPDDRPNYHEAHELYSVMRQTALGVRALLGNPGLRLVGAALVVLAFFEGTADVLVVVLALDLLDIGEGGVGYLNAAWGIGALAGSAALAVMLDRGKLASGLVVGSMIAGVAAALPGAWPVALAGYAGWLAIGVGFTTVEVIARTLLQRLGTDEVLARVLGSLETSRLAAMAVGSIAASALVALLGTRGALLALGAILPLFAVLRWAPLRAFEMGAPVAEGPYALLRANPIFTPLPVATLERLSHDVVALRVDADEQIITQGEHGDRFYLIEDGEVEIFENRVLRRTDGPGESFGEIALLRDVPRTATVRANRPTRLLALDREHFVSAVTGHTRSQTVADTMIDSRLASAPGREPVGKEQ